MQIQASEILAAFQESGLILGMTGPDAAIDGVAPAEECASGNLVFVDREAFVRPVLEARVAAVVTTTELAPAFSEAPDSAVLTTPMVKVARALVTQRFFDRDLRPAGSTRIHPDASVDPEATVAKSATIAAGAVIRAGAVIGENCVILCNAVIEERARVGDGTVIHPCAVIGYECEVGSDVIVRAGASIGSEGFGFAQDERRKSHRIPQLGKVVLEDRVVIGANTCVDRAAHGVTRIGAGTIIDNLCHIAHNVTLGEDCIFMAATCIAGSTKIGNRVISAGQIATLDHLTVTDDVGLGRRAGVVRDITEPGHYAGYPLEPVTKHLRTQLAIERLSGQRSEIKKLEKRIAALEA
ncbi:MAG: UDP-3-O-(3-hydroxymyristoyl)glucosamine N-acyltransferase [Planctomycetota bacterium]|jgi:UDP-3-O-[3-hydroxymyristoyl] glucosamine N-acyltransferase